LKGVRAQVFVSKAEIVGRSKQIKGKLRKEIGKLGHNKTWQLKGHIEQIEGKAREKIGRVVRRSKLRL
jgi:uncharacterized protein YjbJ (UPF0337 family)